MGDSRETLGKSGCTTDAIATAGSYFNEEINPGKLARTLSYTLQGYIIWSSIGHIFKKMTFHWRFYKYDEKMILAGLKNPDTVVILNVDRGYHWVTLLGKWPIFGYRCADPYPYPAKVRYYKPSEVEGGAILTRK